MTSRPEIICSPFNDYEFLLNGNTVTFYKILSYEQLLAKNRLDYYEDLQCEPISVINKNPNQKTCAWYSGHKTEHLIALHEYNSQKIKLLTLNSLNQSNDTNLVGYELTLEKPRQSRCLQWNSKSYLAGGFEFSSGFKSIFIWDVFHQNNKVPIHELETESCYSLCWHPESLDVLYTTSSYQYINLFDLRKNANSIDCINTEFINGFMIDAKDPKYAASYTDTRLAIWDLRKFQEPVIQKDLPANIRKIQFCPSKSNYLTVLTDKSTEFSLYQIAQNDNKNKYLEKVHYYRKKYNEIIINSFAWQKEPYNILTLSNKNTFRRVTIANHSLVEFSNDDQLNVTFMDKMNIFDCSKVSTNEYDEIYIGEIMKKRAMQNYGVQDFTKNINLISDSKYEADVKYLWKWLDLCNKISNENKTTSHLEKFNGLKKIISAGQEKDKNYVQFIEFNKSLVLKLCGWNDWKELVTKLESEKNYERAACISIFNENADGAINILVNASKKSNMNEYLALSIALNHFKNKTAAILNVPDETNEINKEYMQIINKLTNSYLKLLFAYILDHRIVINLIYNDNNVLMTDRIAFGFLVIKNDKQLIAYIDKMMDYCKEEGNLYGILLTGLNIDCVDLFQSYINRTNDVQTPAIAIIHSNIANNQTKTWIECYRDLLDKWMLWEQRALYDICRNRANSVSPKVYVKCGYCGENISTAKIKKTRPAAPTTTATTTIAHGSNITMTCQGCNKPTLRCIVCSLYMNFAPPISAISAETDRMSYAFVFCQKCNHGGHLMHITNWFKENIECPVIQCTCFCNLSIKQPE